MPFWAAATLVSDSETPLDFQVSLEDMVSSTGRLFDGDLSQYSAKGTPFAEGDVLFGKLRPYLAKYWLADRAGTAGGDIHVYRPNAGIEPRYLVYIVGSRNFVRFAEAASKGVKMPRAEWMSLREYPVTAHDLEAQRAIADYLDRETGEIDAMIAKMDELAETLRVRRKAVVLGVLAELPSRTRLTLILDVVSGAGFPDKYQGLSGEELPFYKVSSLSTVKHGRLGDAENSVSRDVADELRARVIPSGSVVMAKIGAALLLARYALTTRPACIDNNMQALVPREGSVDSRFLSYAMEEVSVHSLVKPGPVPSLDVMGMKMTDVAYHPSLDEQRRIADHLDEVTGKIDAMLAKVAELKSLLIERRAALITDVVTGRKKVA
jgi:type I restriction-modification system, specificity subunit